jgi:hypothetical protein
MVVRHDCEYGRLKVCFWDETDITTKLSHRRHPSYYAREGGAMLVFVVRRYRLWPETGGKFICRPTNRLKGPCAV